jgi:hypothetical protein
LTIFPLEAKFITSRCKNPKKGRGSEASTIGTMAAVHGSQSNKSRSGSMGAHELRGRGKELKAMVCGLGKAREANAMIEALMTRGSRIHAERGALQTVAGLG